MSTTEMNSHIEIAPKDMPPGKLWRLTVDNEVHRGFRYQTGLNIDTEPFNPNGACAPGGLYFFHSDDLACMYNYIFVSIVWVREVTLPADARVYKESGKYKADKFILGRRKPLITLFKRYYKLQTSRALAWAVQNDYPNIVRFLLTAKRIDESQRHEATLHSLSTVSNKSSENMCLLILEDPRVDPSAEHNIILGRACAHGYTLVVKKLLADPRVDPCARDNAALIAASAPLHDEVMKLLLADGRADPSARDNMALSLAAERGNVRMMKLLLADTRVDPSANANNPLFEAVRRNRIGAVRLLMSYPQVNPSDRDNYAVRMSAANGITDLVELLLTDPRVNPGSRNNEALRKAVEKGHIDVVKLLFADKRVDPTVNNNQPLREAINRNWRGIEQLLRSPS